MRIEYFPSTVTGKSSGVRPARSVLPFRTTSASRGTVKSVRIGGGGGLTAFGSVGGLAGEVEVVGEAPGGACARAGAAIRNRRAATAGPRTRFEVMCDPP